MRGGDGDVSVIKKMGPKSITYFDPKTGESYAYVGEMIGENLEWLQAHPGATIKVCEAPRPPEPPPQPKPPRQIRELTTEEVWDRVFGWAHAYMGEFCIGTKVEDERHELAEVEMCIKAHADKENA